MRRRSTLFLAALFALGCATGGGSLADAGRRGDAGRAGEDAALPSDGGATSDAGSVGDAALPSPSDDAGALGCGALACDANATCDESSGTARCVCNPGYTGTGLVCTDVDECATVPSPCPAGACINEEGGFSCDLCPADPAKTEPGLCGCGTPDTDTDADGTPDCHDGCPSDPAKTAPGMCGCGRPEGAGGSTWDLAPARSQSFSGGAYFRGNAYQVTTSQVLQSFEQYLSVPSGCGLDFYVLRGSSGSGPWTTVWSASRSGSGAAYHSSGPIGITLSAGYYYALGVGWRCTATYYGSDTGVISGALGTFRNNIYDNGYSAYRTNYSPPSTGTSSLTYSQRITVGSCP